MTSKRSCLVKEGYMKTKGNLLGMWKKVWVMLFRASSSSPCHLEQFENRDNGMAGVDPEVTVLADVEHAQLEYSNDLFVITLIFFKGKKKKFAIESESEAYDWFEILKQQIGETSPPLTSESQQRSVRASPGVIPGMFNVFLRKNSKTRFSGDYLLQVTGDSIILHASSDGKTPLVTWNIKALRRYGRSNGTFTFEAGRTTYNTMPDCGSKGPCYTEAALSYYLSTCNQLHMLLAFLFQHDICVCHRRAETGEGVFAFQTADADEIYQRVHSAAQALAATGKGSTSHRADLIREGDCLPVSRPVSKPLSKPGTKPVSKPVSKPGSKQKPRSKVEVVNNSTDDDYDDDDDDDDDTVLHTKAASTRAPQPLPRSIKKKSEAVSSGLNNLMYAEPEDGHQASIPSDEDHLSDFDSVQTTFSSGLDNLMYAEPEDGHQASIPSDEDHLSDFDSEQITYGDQRVQELYGKVTPRAEQKDINDKTNYELEKPTTDDAGGESSVNLEYIYEEKGLTKSFRQFLHIRKEDDC